MTNKAVPLIFYTESGEKVQGYASIDVAKMMKNPLTNSTPIMKPEEIIHHGSAYLSDVVTLDGVEIYRRTQELVEHLSLCE